MPKGISAHQWSNGAASRQNACAGTLGVVGIVQGRAVQIFELLVLWLNEKRKGLHEPKYQSEFIPQKTKR